MTNKKTRNKALKTYNHVMRITVANELLHPKPKEEKVKPSYTQFYQL